MRKVANLRHGMAGVEGLRQVRQFNALAWLTGPKGAAPVIRIPNRLANLFGTLVHSQAAFAMDAGA
jgi:hypothetical protein